MDPLKARLAQRQKPIRVSVIGIGSIGKGLAYQCYKTPGFQLVAIADITLARAIDCAKWLSMPYSVCETSKQIETAIAAGKLAVCQDGIELAAAAGADVMIEALNCVAEAVLDGTSRLAPTAGMRTNVFCYAKHDLKACDTIDGMGGFATYGVIENLTDSGLPPGLPQLISDGIRVNRAIKKDQRIALSDCDADLKSPEFSLYAQACAQ